MTRSRVGLPRTLAFAMISAFMIISFVAPVAQAETLRARGRLARPRVGIGMVRGMVFQDWNQNGQRDPLEPGLGAATLLLRDSRGRLVARYVTGQEGTYEFAEIFPGRYILSEVDPEGYSSLQRHKLAITVKGGGTVMVDFGDVLLLGGRPRSR